jgi:hypothetical protein
VTLDDFKKTITQAKPPSGLAPAVVALWHDAHGEWEAAHHVAQDIEDASGAWVHAYLHRKEGDLGNAGYWYRRAGKPQSSVPLEVEWEEIATALLEG